MVLSTEHDWWSRRKLLKSGAGLAALLALDACAPAVPQATAPKTSNAVKGGHITEAPTFEQSHVNPLLPIAPAGATMMFDGLLTLLPDGSLTPLLAKSLPKISDDGRTYTFDLRNDVKWTDNTQLTADDVVFTYQLLYHPDYKAFATPNRGALENLIDNVTAPDPYTVVISTKRTNAAFLALHSTYGVQPKHVLRSIPAENLQKHDFMQAPTVTNGPFKFKEWIKGDHMTLLRNEASYRGVPYVDSYVFKYYPQQATIITALKAGDIDVTGTSQAVFFDELKSNPSLNNVTYVTGSAPHVAYNLDPSASASKVFSSKVVRQAMLYAADREGAAKANLFGSGSRPASTGVFWEGNWANNPNAKPDYEYNKEKAAQMLDAEGWKIGASGIREKDGVPMKFTIQTSVNNNVWVQTATIFQQNWKDIGIDVTVVPVQYAQLITTSMAREFDLLVFENVMLGQADPDPSDAYHSRSAVKNAGRNFANYKNPALDSLLDEAVSMLDQAKRKDTYLKVQDIINDDVPAWSTWFWQTVWFSNKRVASTGPQRFGAYTANLRSFMNEFYVTDGK
jgi:peptide/nickel transport system substrate-binding protein